MDRAVIYARVSGDDSKYKTSGIESQLEDCRRYCSDLGYRVIAEYYEEPNTSTSGADWLPESERVMILAAQGGFDVLVVRELDRLARSFSKQQGIQNYLGYQEVRIEYVIGQYQDTAEGRLSLNVASSVAEYEREKTRERTTRGRVKSVNAGNVIVGACLPFGYNVTESNGVREFVIDESEAAVVRLMFEMYAEGASATGIAHYFTENKIPKPGASEKRQAHGEITKNGIWHAATITSMLDNETYVGRWHYRKTKPVKQPGGKVKNVPRPREEWLMVEVPAIVEPETFDIVQERKRRNRRVRGKQHKHFYTLGGMLRCGHCGKSMSGVTKVVRGRSYAKYVCLARHSPKRFGFRCDLPYYKVEEIDAVTWAWVRRFLFDAETLEEAFNEYQRGAYAENATLLNMVNANKRREQELEEEKARLVKAYSKGVLSLDEIAQDKTAIETELTNLREATGRLEQELRASTLTEADIASIQEMAAAMSEEIDLADSDREAQRDILSMLEFTATLYVEDGETFLDVACILGSDTLSTSQATYERGRQRWQLRSRLRADGTDLAQALFAVVVPVR